MVRSFGCEVIDVGSRELERIMLGIRLREGVALASLGDRPSGPPAGRPDIARATPPTWCPSWPASWPMDCLKAGAAIRGCAVLTLRGPLMADTVTRTLPQCACKAATAGGRETRASCAAGRREVYIGKGLLTSESVY